MWNASWRRPAFQRVAAQLMTTRRTETQPRRLRAGPQTVSTGAATDHRPRRPIRHRDRDGLAEQLQEADDIIGALAARAQRARRRSPEMVTIFQLVDDSRSIRVAYVGEGVQADLDSWTSGDRGEVPDHCQSYAAYAALRGDQSDDACQSVPERREQGGGCALVRVFGPVVMQAALGHDALPASRPRLSLVAARPYLNGCMLDGLGRYRRSSPARGRRATSAPSRSGDVAASAGAGLRARRLSRVLSALASAP